MYCKKCGNEVSFRDKVCPHCGTPIHEVEKTLNYERAEQTSNFEQNPNIEQKTNTEKIESSTIGVLAIVFSAIGSFVGFILSIIGLLTYKNAGNKRLCKIALIIICVWFVISIVSCVVLIDSYSSNIPPEFYY